MEVLAELHQSRVVTVKSVSDGNQGSVNGGFQTSEKNERATTKGQNRFGTFSHFFALFPPGLFFKLRPFSKTIKR